MDEIIKGIWRLEAGSWKLEAGRWRPEAGSWKLEGGRWRLEAGSRKLEAGRWGLEAGRWRPEAGRWKLEAGRWKLEAGRWKLEAGRWGLEAGRWGLEAGRWKLEAGRWRPEGGRWRLEGGRWRKWRVWMRIISLMVLISSFQFPSSLSAQQPLEIYLTQASENNPGLQAQYAAFEAGLERAAQVSGLPNPSLSFGYFIQPVETRVGPQRARFSLSQMFPWFGSLSAKGDAAAAIARAKYYQFIDAREKLASEVKTSYYELWQIREIIELERENLQLLESYEVLATTRIRSGEGKLSDAYRVQLEIEESQTRIDILKNQLAQLKRSFNRTLNREAEMSVELPDTLIPTHNFLQPDSAIRHPSIERFRQMEKGSVYQISAAKKNALPSFGLGLDYVLVDERTNMDVPDNGKDVVMPMLSLSLPIWQKQYTAARKEAELRQRQYQLEADEAINRLSSQNDLAEFRLQEAENEMQLYHEEISLANKTLELTITDYTNGREDFEEILRLQQKIIQYKKQHLKAYRAYLDSVARLEYLNYRITEGE